MIRGGVFMKNNNYECKENMRYLTASVKEQKFENIMSVQDALCHGTIFKDLYIPFECYKNNAIMNPFK